MAERNPGDQAAQAAGSPAPSPLASPPAGGHPSQPPAGGTGTAGSAPAPEGYVRKEDVQRMIDQALTGQQGQQSAANTRERFIREKLSDLPLAVQNLMPQTGDPKQLAQAEQELRGQLIQWAAKAGFKVPNAGGDPAAGGVSPIQTATTGGPPLSPTERFAAALAPPKG